MGGVQCRIVRPGNGSGAWKLPRMSRFLAPAHAAQIAVALGRLKPHQAVIALLPELAELSIALCCQNFSKDIAAHRLWFVAGENWREQLSQLLCNNPGLT